MPKKSKAVPEPKVSTEFVPKALPGEKDNWIILEFKLINWKYMNFTLKVNENTHVFSIKNILRDRHGRMDDLKICFKAFTESNEVKNDMLTLLDCGLKGDVIKVSMDPLTGRMTRDESNLPIVQVLYDFKPNEVTVDPILLYYK